MDKEQLTPWSELYRTHSVYAINIYSSGDKYRLYILFTFIIIVWLLPFTSIMLVVATLAAMLVLNGCFPETCAEQKPLLSTLMLSHDGYCIFEQGPLLKLVNGSRVGFAGCWLIFTDDFKDDVINTKAWTEAVKQHKRLYRPDSVNSRLKSRFIFKNSLSKRDFARLSRVIVALKKRQGGC